jgi:Phosphotransferase enzyme family
MHLIKFLLPADPSITTPHIWHPDLHADNIFVDPDQPTEIIGIIDWQSIALVPLFENIFRPALLDYDGPPLNGLERPEEPKNLDHLDPVQRAAAFDRYMDMTMASYYPNLIYYTNKRLFKAIEFRESITFDLLSYARNILIDGEAIYQERITDELQKAWDTIPGVQAQNNPPYPIFFSAEELATIREDCQAMCDGIMCMRQIQEEMGPLFPFDRCISHESYDEVKRILDEYKEKVLHEFARNDEERAAVMAWWPFD